MIRVEDDHPESPPSGVQLPLQVYPPQPCTSVQLVGVGALQLPPGHCTPPPQEALTPSTVATFVHEVELIAPLQEPQTPPVVLQVRVLAAFPSWPLHDPWAHPDVSVSPGAH